VALEERNGAIPAKNWSQRLEERHSCNSLMPLKPCFARLEKLEKSQLVAQIR
jgi:hypothetical protein